MKSQKLFAGITLIGFGIYFILKNLNISLFPQFFSWQTLLIIIGLAFLFQGYGGKDYPTILPGIILTGFGLHFHLVDKLAIWPDHTGTFLLIIALGFILQNHKTGNGMMNGVLFLILAGLLLFFQEITESIHFLQSNNKITPYIMPLILLLIGGYFLLTKKK